MKPGQIDWRIGKISAVIALVGMLILGIDIAIKQSNSHATGNDTVASAQSAGASVTPSDPNANNSVQ